MQGLDRYGSQRGFWTVSMACGRQLECLSHQQEQEWGIGAC